MTYSRKVQKFVLEEEVQVIYCMCYSKAGTSKWDKCCSCCAGVPYPSLGAWLLLAISVFVCCGALIVAEQKTNDLLQKDSVIPFQKEICIGVMAGMILFACLHLLAATLASQRLRPKCFNSKRRNICGRILTVTVAVLACILHLAWQLLATIIAIPIFFFGLLHYVYKAKGDNCVDLKLYGLAEQERKICGIALEKFYDDAFGTMQCYAIAFIGAVFIVFSLNLVGICSAANFVYLKESRFANYYAYEVEKPEKNKPSSNDNLNGTEICSPLVYQSASNA